jgi:hypothetical protein
MELYGRSRKALCKEFQARAVVTTVLCQLIPNLELQSPTNGRYWRAIEIEYLTTGRYHVNCYEQHKHVVLVERQDALNIMHQSLVKNAQNINTHDKSELTVLTVFGFVGIGKTALGLCGADLELDNKPVVYAIIDFSNGDKMEGDEDCARGLALRVFARLFCKVNYCSFAQSKDGAKLLANVGVLGEFYLSKVLAAYKTINGGRYLLSFFIIVLTQFYKAWLVYCTLTK